MVIRLTLPFMLFLIWTGGNSQDLEVHLNIESNNEVVFLRIDGKRAKTDVPYLSITYKNIGNSPIYFKKILSQDVISFPGNELIIDDDIDLIQGKKYLKVFTNPMNTEISIGFSNPENGYIIDSSSLILLNTYNVRIKNTSAPSFFSQVGLLKKIIASQLALDTKNQLAFFDYPQKKIIRYQSRFEGFSLEGHTVSDNGYFPVSKYENQFIFLKEKEEYTERLNLLPLKLLGGTYCFFLNHYQFDSYLKIYNSGINDSLKPYFTILKLPEKFKNYHLFHGEPLYKDTCIQRRFNNDKKIFILGRKNEEEIQ